MKDVTLTCGLIEAHFRTSWGGFIYKPDAAQIGMMNAKSGSVAVADLAPGEPARLVCNLTSLAQVGNGPMTSAEVVVGARYRFGTTVSPQERVLSAPFLCGEDSAACEQGGYPIRTDADPNMQGT